MDWNTTFSSLPRPATAEEREQLKQYWIGLGEDEENSFNLVNCASIAIFPDYQTGCPGYCGDVMVVIYEAGPEQVESFIWDEGHLQRSWPYDETR